MDDPLERLIRDLREEKCPGAVLDRVARRTGQGQGPGREHRGRVSFRGWLVGAAAVTAVLVAALLLLGQGAAGPGIHREAAPHRAALSPAAIDRALVIEQAQGALVFIGRVLIEAGAHTQDALVTEAVPPLVDGFRTATTKLTKPL